MARIHKFEDSTVQLLRSTCDQKGTEGISGLIYGVFQAWKDEKAVAIAPQHIWFTITCQVAKYVKDHPDSFRSIFSDQKEGKQQITLVTAEPDIVDPNLFIRLLAQKISSVALLDLMVKPFPTRLHGEVVPFSEVMSTVMLEAASPFFDYMTTRCGLREIRLEGTAEDWADLVNRIRSLKVIIGGIEFSKNSWHQTTINEALLNKSLERVIDLSDRVLGEIETDDTFVENCFWAGENCHSGHIYNASGWIFDFYDSKVLSECAKITYVSWLDLDTNRMFYQAYGLTNGNYDDQDVLRMSFSKWTYEVFSRELFDKIKG
jgi:hypothetical protein